MNNIFKMIMMIGLSVNLFANNNEFIIQTFSYHTEKTYELVYHDDKGNIAYTVDKEYRNENYGLYYQRKINDYLKVGVGAYKNSVYRNSYAAGFELYHEFDNFEVGTTLGLVSGYRTGYIYEKTGEAINPMWSVNASYKVNDTINLKLVTVIIPENGYVLTPQLVIKF